MTLKERPTQTIITSIEPEVKGEIKESQAPPAVVDANRVEFEGKTYTRQGNAKFWIVLDYLRANPGARDLSVRKLADKVEVSKTIAELAKKCTGSPEAKHSVRDWVVRWLSQ